MTYFSANLARLWVSSFLSTLALSCYLLTEQWYVVDHLDAAGSLGIVLAATTLPRLLLMLLGGYASDRWPKPRILFVANALRCGVILSLTLCYLYDQLSLFPLIAFAVVFGILDAIGVPAANSIVPSVVAKEDIAKANGLILSSNQFALMGGPLIAGFLVANGAYENSFLFIGFILIVAAFLVRRIDVTTSSHEPVENEGVLNSVTVGLKYIGKTPQLLFILILLAVVNIFYFGPILVGLPVFAKNVLNGGALVVSQLQGSYAGGMIAGSIVGGLLKKVREVGIVPRLISLLGLCLIVFSVNSAFSVAILLLAIMGAISAFLNIVIISWIQGTVSKKLIGRVMSSVSLISSGLLPISFLIFGFFLSKDTRVELLIGLCGGMLFLVAVFGQIVWSTRSFVSRT